jgi:hypothetical protein
MPALEVLALRHRHSKTLPCLRAFPRLHQREGNWITGNCVALSVGDVHPLCGRVYRHSRGKLPYAHSFVHQEVLRANEDGSIASGVGLHSETRAWYPGEFALDEFRSLGIQFLSHQENIDTSSPLGQAVFTIVAAVATLERDLIRDRVRAGLRNARSKGKGLGRPRVVVNATQIASLRASGVSRLLVVLRKDSSESYGHLGRT